MGITAAQMAQVSLVSQIGGMASSGIGAFYGARASKRPLPGRPASSMLMRRSPGRRPRWLKPQPTTRWTKVKRVGAVTMKYGQVKAPSGRDWRRTGGSRRWFAAELQPRRT